MYMRVFNAAIEHLPPQFQDYENARYALDVWALQHPMPLTVLAHYIRLVSGTPFMVLAGALACLSSGRADAMVFGVLFLAGFVYSVFYAFKCSRIYEQNCKRAEARDDEENQRATRGPMVDSRWEYRRWEARALEPKSTIPAGFIRSCASLIQVWLCARVGWTGSEWTVDR